MKQKISTLTWLLATGCWLLLLSGCGLAPQKADKGEVDMLGQGDAYFGDALAKKDKLDTQIAQIRRMLEEDRRDIEGQISQLRQDFQARKAQTNAKITELKKQLEPQRQTYLEKIRVTNEELALKNKAVKSLRAAADNAKTLLEGKNGVELPEEEKASWHKRLNSLVEEAQTLDIEIAKLKEELRILRLKFSALRQ